MGPAIIWLVNSIIGLMILFIFVSAILSWLVAFDVINPRNRLVYSVLSFLDAVTRPLMEPFRRIIPPMGGVDIEQVAREQGRLVPPGPGSNFENCTLLVGFVPGK